MDKDLKELLSALNARGVKYMVVGGYAVSIHAQPRVTKDIGIFIEMSRSNAAAVYAALADFGAPVGEFNVADFLEPASIFRIGVPPVAVDILPQIDGVSVEKAWASSEECLIDGEVRARYISAEDLITNKPASGRPQDLADVEAIRQTSAAQTRKSGQ